jgi:hypothetical protein
MFHGNISPPSSGLKSNPSKNLSEEGGILSWFLSWLTLSLEDGDTFLQNVSMSRNYAVLQSRRPHSA